MLSPAALKALRVGYAEQAIPVQQRQAEAAALERTVSDLVNAASYYCQCGFSVSGAISGAGEAGATPDTRASAAVAMCD